MRALKVLSAEKMIDQVPELATRHLLLSEMQHNRFQCSDTLENAALIPKTEVAVYVISLIWREMRKDLNTYWRDSLREQTGNDRLYNELFGCIMNIAGNMKIKARFAPPKNICYPNVLRIYK